MEDIFRKRAIMYNLLSKLYLKEADALLLSTLQMVDYSGFDEDTEMDRGFRMLGEAVKKTTPFTLTQLAREYARSFYGAGLPRNTGAYPYESVYTSADHLLMQDARDEVVKFYQSEDLGRKEEFKEPEDHVAFELEFMSRLCDMAANLAAAGDTYGTEDYVRKQQEFFSEHLYNWVPRFCDDLERLALEPFYKAAAIITRAFLYDESELLDCTVN